MFVLKLELTYILKIDCQAFKCTMRSAQTSSVCSMGKRQQDAGFSKMEQRFLIPFSQYLKQSL
jgi:hypothetical protein